MGESLKSNGSRSAAALSSLTGGGALTCMLGLAAVRVWLQCILFDSYTQADDGIFTIINNFGYGAVILAGALIALRRPPGARMQARLGWVAFALMLCAPFGLLAIPGQLTLGQMVAVGLVAGVAGGLGAGVWTALYARLGVRQIVLYGMTSLALGSVGGFIVSFMPPDPGQITSILMAAIAQMCYRHALQVVGPSEAPAGAGAFERPYLPRDPEPVYDHEPRSTAVFILCGLAVFGFALGISRGYPAGEPISMGPALRALHQLGVAALAVFVMRWTLVRGRRLSFSLLWRIEIGVAAAGALALSIMPDGFDAVAIALENIADSFMLGVLWVTMADASRHSSRHAYAVFGIVWAVRVFSREAGRILVLVLGSVAAAPQTGVVIGTVTAAIGASMALLLSENVPHTRQFFELDEDGEAGEVARAGALAPTGAPGAGGLGPAGRANRADRVGAPAPAVAGWTGATGAGGANGQGGRAGAGRTAGVRVGGGSAAGWAGATGEVARAGAPAPTGAAVEGRMPASGGAVTAGCTPMSASAAAGGAATAYADARPSCASAYAAACSSRAPAATAGHPSHGTAPAPAVSRDRGAACPPASPDPAGAAGLSGVEEIALSPVELAREERLRADFGLSAREAQVAVLIAQGRSKAAIARQLYVSENTVRTHAKNAYSKLGVCSKTELEALLRGLA